MNKTDSINCASKWNERYISDKRFSDAPVRSLIVSNQTLLPKSGWALEIAGGMGVTTDFMQKAGLQVVEIDIAFNALKIAHENNSSAFHIVSDARFLPINHIQFDIICNFYYLERSIFGEIERHLKPGGLLFFESMTVEMMAIRPETPPIRFLEPGELLSAFSTFEILHYYEGWVTSDHGKQKAIAQLIARKPCYSV